MSKNAPEARSLDVTIIVVTRNNEPFIEACLRSIELAVSRSTCEIIVVDNGSTDSTLRRLPSDIARMRVIALCENTGFAAANNRGLDVSRGRLIALVNSDAFPDPGSIDRLVESIDALPGAAIVGGKLRYPDGRLQPSHGRFPSLLGNLWVALALHRAPFLGRAKVGIAADPDHYRAPHAVDWVTGAFCIARRDTGQLPAAGFMYGEDVGWAARATSEGSTVWFEPRATAVHVGRASVDQSQDEGFAQRQRVRFELAWFAPRGRMAVMAARAILALHAIVRLAAYAGLAAVRRQGDPRVAEYRVLLSSALTERARDVDSRSPLPA